MASSAPPEPDTPKTAPAKKESPWGRSCRIFFFVILAILVLAGVGVGIYFAVRNNARPQSPTAPISTPAGSLAPSSTPVTWGSNIILNPSFELAGAGAQTTASWSGNYDIVPTSTAPNPPPFKDGGSNILQLSSSGTLGTSGKMGMTAIQTLPIAGEVATAINCSVWIDTSTITAPLVPNGTSQVSISVRVAYVDTTVADSTHKVTISPGLPWKHYEGVLRLTDSPISRVIVALLHENFNEFTYADKVFCAFTKDVLP